MKNNLNSGKEDKEHFDVDVDVVEMLGKEKILYTRLADQTELIMSTPGHYEYQSGEKHHFGLDVDALHFFDTLTSLRINR